MKTFGILPRADGQWEVIFEDNGRPAAPPRPSKRSANGLARAMNERARNGQLDRALGCDKR